MQSHFINDRKGKKWKKKRFSSALFGFHCFIHLPAIIILPREKSFNSPGMSSLKSHCFSKSRLSCDPHKGLGLELEVLFSQVLDQLSPSSGNQVMGWVSLATGAVLPLLPRAELVEYTQYLLPSATPQPKLTEMLQVYDSKRVP